MSEEIEPMDVFAHVEGLQATAHHISVIARKLSRLQQAKEDSWDQILTGLARMVTKSKPWPDPIELLSYITAMKITYGVGFTRVWDRNMPKGYSAANIRARDMSIRFRKIDADHNQPNGPNGTWFGIVGESGPTPLFGESVVYVLFDELNDPVYVGSTERFYTRLKDHIRTKPGIKRWAAYPCRDREHAYRMEEQLLDQHMPRMNRKRGR